MLRSKVGGIPQLTVRERIFANEFVKTKNATKSALKAFGSKRRSIAAVVGSQVMNRPIVKDYIETALREADYNPVNTIRSLIEIEREGRKDKARVADSLRASENLLKLTGALNKQQQNLSLNLSIDNLDTLDLLKLKQKYDKLLDS